MANAAKAKASHGSDIRLGVCEGIYVSFPIEVARLPNREQWSAVMEVHFEYCLDTTSPHFFKATISLATLPEARLTLDEMVGATNGAACMPSTCLGKDHPQSRYICFHSPTASDRLTELTAYHS